MEDKVIGIIGGMGPEATIDLFQRIVQNTKGVMEEEQLHILIDNNPKLPSRQEAILNGKESPLPMLITMAQNLERNGAQILLLAANTPHYYYEEICKHIQVTFLHMIEETAKYIVRQHPNCKSVGILATNAVLATGIYKKAFAKFGIVLKLLEKEKQQKLHNAILVFKDDGDKETFSKVVNYSIEEYLKNGSSVIVLGCTEIPLVTKSGKYACDIVNPNEIIARIAVELAKNKG